jgi:hypothetical protein
MNPEAAIPPSGGLDPNATDVDATATEADVFRQELARQNHPQPARHAP